MSETAPRKSDVLQHVLGTSPKPHTPPDESIEMHDDADARFRAAVHAAAKSGPKHREPQAR